MLDDQTTNDILNDFISSLKTDLINSLQANGKIATGQTASQINITAYSSSIKLDLPAYLLILEKGRGPTGKNALPGNPPMIQRIQQWCDAKGIPGSAAWAIKKHIDKVGYPGKPGLVSLPLGDDNINLRLSQFLPAVADNISTQIINALSI
jgi:hypothetical protein